MFSRSMFMLRFFSLCGVAALVSTASAATYTVDAIKPHYQCNDAVPEGEERVRQYIRGVLADKSDIVVVQDMQFSFDKTLPKEYMAFGGNCVVKWAQSAAVFVNTDNFDFLEPIGSSIVGYDGLPWLPNNPTPSHGDMCVQANISDGARPWTGGLLRHRNTGSELCVVAGTFPHCDGPWSSQFTSAVQEQCKSKSIMFVGDTNAGCPGHGGLDSKITMQEILQRHDADWGQCSDLGTSKPPTCCNDISQGKPYARLWLDRTAICGGGIVKSFQVNKQFVCGTNEEHLYTKAVIDLPSPKFYTFV